MARRKCTNPQGNSRAKPALAKPSAKTRAPRSTVADARSRRADMSTGLPVTSVAASARRYADVLSFLAAIESDYCAPTHRDLRQSLSAAAVTRLQREHPGLPADYADYLREVGWGSFLRCRYTVYSELLPLADRLGEQAAGCLSETVLCFGDNLHGDIAGFLPERNWAVVEIRHLDQGMHTTGQTFGDFIREQLGLDGDGAEC